MLVCFVLTLFIQVNQRYSYRVIQINPVYLYEYYLELNLVVGSYATFGGDVYEFLKQLKMAQCQSGRICDLFMVINTYRLYSFFYHWLQKLFEICAKINNKYQRKQPANV